MLSVVSAGQPNALNDKEVKRNKQAEYAKQLQQDTGSAAPLSQQQYQYQQQQRQGPTDHNEGGGGLSAIGKGVVLYHVIIP